MPAKGGTGIAKMTWYIDYHSEMPQKMLPCKDYSWWTQWIFVPMYNVQTPADNPQIYVTTKIHFFHKPWKLESTNLDKLNLLIYF
jgi:hypothetical protein